MDQRPQGVIVCWGDDAHNEAPWKAIFSIGPDWAATTIYPTGNESIEAFSERAKAECISIHGQLPLAWEIEDALL